MNPVRLSMSVMLAPSPLRRKIVSGMLGYLKPDTSLLERGRIEVIEDTWRQGCWPTARRAWESMPEEATHHAVIQDDIGVCRDFIPALIHLITLYPQSCLSTEHHSPSIIELSRKHNVHLIEIPGRICAPCIVAPVDMVQDFLAWQDRNIKPEYNHDDSRWAAYLLDKRIQTLVTTPTLTQHLLPRRSLNNNNVDLNRVSPDWIEDHGVSPLSIPWHFGHPSPPAASIGGRHRIQPEFWLRS